MLLSGERASAALRVCLERLIFFFISLKHCLREGIRQSKGDKVDSSALFQVRKIPAISEKS